MTPIRVLIADHDELLLENYTAFFRKISWETAVASSGLQGVEQLRTFRPDVLVLEPELPWGGGAFRNLTDNLAGSAEPCEVTRA